MKRVATMDVGRVRFPFRATRLVTLILIAVLMGTSRAENIVFPASSSVKNVKTVYGAAGNGTKDDTEALRTAFRAGWGGNLIYLPNGTYRVTGSIVCRGEPGVGPWIYGQSRDGVVIKLDDNAPGFGDSAKALAQPVIAAHSHLPGARISADMFMRQWHNFTVDAGNNPGAIGIRYYSNNSGVLDNVRIVGNGKYGIDLGWTDMNGPCLIQDVEVDGFAFGIYSCCYINSQTFVNVTVRNSKKTGVYLWGQTLNIEDLVVENVPTPVHGEGMLCLINTTLRGSDPALPGVANRAHMYGRNITTTGCSQSITSMNGGVTGAFAGEFMEDRSRELQHVGAFTNRYPHSLHLPIKKSPRLVWESDTSKWVSANRYGAVANDGRDDTKGLQDAIDAAAVQGKTVVFLESGSYNLGSTVYIHGPVRHILGMGYARVLPTSGGGQGFTLRDNAAPLVRIENFYSFGGGSRTIVNNNTSTLVVEHGDGWRFLVSGGGDVFINNVVGSMEITNPAAHVWIRQWNTEGRAVDTDNKGGFLWILGLKTEHGMMKIRTSNGGKTELLGAHIYNLCDVSGVTSKAEPVFEIIDAFASFASVREVTFCQQPYQFHVRETRKGQTMTYLDRTDKAWALYSGADSLFVPPVVPGVGVLRPAHGSKLPGHRLLDAAPAQGVSVFDCRGRRVAAVRIAKRRIAGSAGVYIVSTATGNRLAFSGER